MVVESISIPPIRRNSSNTPTPTPLALTEDNPISLKVSKILICPIDDVKTKSALEALSEFYTSNSVTERRNLRGNIEQKAIETNRNFLETFGKVTEQLAVIESEIKNMNNFCDEISKSLDSAKRQTALLLEQSDSLKSQRESCKTRKILIDAFLGKFTLSEKEVATLFSPDSGIGPGFFEVLKHLQQIHSDCDALLITENQRAGLEIMERMNSYQETAFDKLYRWTQTESRSLGRDTQEVPITLKLALKTLKQRPVLFQSCLEELVYIRRNSIIRAFTDALTRGGPGGTPRPIELHAHDPLRYVGDMLAWIHQTVANEREFLESLFEVKNESEHSNVENLDKESDDIVIQDLLDRDLDGTCRPLKFQSTVKYEKLHSLFFEIDLLYEFCSITDSASRVFFNTLNMQAEQLLRYRQTPGVDLMPPPAVKETVLQLKEIMASYETSLVTATEREDDFRTILDTILDPLFQMCELGANDLPKFDKAIYMINCLHYVQSSLTPYSFTHGRVMSLERQIEENMEILVDGQYANLLNQSGLGPIVQIMETKDED
ncbi:23992_t:CDS:10, partial [Dentiscutata erythropus]